MKRFCKYAMLMICVTLFVGNALCLAQTDGQAANPPTPPTTSVVGPMSDFDQVTPNNGPLGTRAEHWRERSGGSYLEYFDVTSGVILGWTIYPASNRGYDKWGNVDSSFTAYWSTMGYSRWAGSSEVAYTSPYPFSSYSYINAWGLGGSGSMNTPSGYFNGSLYESCFDGAMTGPGGIAWTDDGSGTWSALYVSDPGNYIDNRVYDLAGDGTIAWRAAAYPYGYSSTYGFSFNADCRRLDGQLYSYGIQYFADVAAGPNSDCYGFWITDTMFSVWAYVGGVSTNVYPWTTTSMINPVGEWNNLRVETLSGNTELFINDVSVATFTDSTHTSGYIGVAGYDGTGSANIQWDNMTVHRQPSVLVGGEGKPNQATTLWPDTGAGQ